MVRFAYRTSSGIYGPKDAPFPKTVDVEMQLKRCRLREHSLKKCISVLLVVVAVCMSGLIVGLLSTCKDEDNLEEVKVDFDLKSMVTDTQQTRQEENNDTSKTMTDEKYFTTGSSLSNFEAVMPGTTELIYDRPTLEVAGNIDTTIGSLTTTTTTTTTHFEISENIPININETDSVEDATTQRVDNKIATLGTSII